MCGIVAYLGQQKALPVLLEGLKRLEYRGYDSAGVAVLNDGAAFLHRAVGKISSLEKGIEDLRCPGTAGIAHTRWATHGKPSVENAHPHSSCDKKVHLVHNGIVENYVALRAELQQEGHRFTSETDTEVLVHLVEKYLKEAGSLTGAVQKTLRRVSGTFGIAVVSQDSPREIVVAKRSSPLVLGIGDGEILAASDVSAFVRFAKQVVYLEDNEVATLRPEDYSIVTVENQVVERETQTVDWSHEALDKKEFKHHMLKEIHEQPETVVNAVRGRLMPEEGVSRLGGIAPVLEQLRRADRLSIISCGTSYYAGIYGKYVFEALTHLQVDVSLASEFRYRRVRFDPNSVVLAISQSGETADTLAAVQEAKRKGALTLGIVNVVGSSIARAVHAGVYMHAGPEVGVASTKCFLSQTIIMLLMAILFGRYEDLTYNEGLKIIKDLEKLPDWIRAILSRKSDVEAVARKYAGHKNFLYIGRHFNYPIALEGALKLKEISYLHAEGYAAGEMKHGPIALIDENFPTVAVMPQDEMYEKMVSNVQEIKARNGKVIAVATEGDEHVRALADDVIYVPRASDILSPLLAVVPLQLFAYYLADILGCEVDKPRNLAKSVTVE